MERLPAPTLLFTAAAPPLGGSPRQRGGAVRGQSPTALRAALREEAKAALVGRLLAAKERSGKTFNQIAEEIGLTNAYTANLFYNQAQLKPGSAPKLAEAVPGIDEQDLREMQKPPFRSFDPAILQEPLIYRLHEAVGHYGEAIKALVNEQIGDGIMSAIDLYMDVGKTRGKQGETRVVITMNGKFLPFIEQVSEDNVLSNDTD